MDNNTLDGFFHRKQKEETGEAPIFEDIAQKEENFVKDPTDFTDGAAELMRQRRNKSLALVAVGLALVLAAFYFFTNSKKEAPLPTSTPQVTVSTSGPTKVTDASAGKPLVKQYPNAPKVAAGEVVVKTSKNTVVAGPKAKLTLLKSTVTPAVASCRTMEPTDFCLVGQAVLKENNTAFDIYYLKDAVNSRLFEATENYQEQKVKGSPAAGTLALNLGNAKVQTLVAVNPDSSGWMFVLAPQAKLDAVLADVTIG